MTTAVTTALPGDTRQAWRRAALACAAVGAVFCMLIVAQLIVTLLQDKASNPLVADQLTTMRAALQTHAADDALKTQVEREDQRVRLEFVQRCAAMNREAWLLLGGAVALVASVKAWRQLSQRQPELEEVRQIRASRVDAAARWAVMGAGAALSLLMVMAVVMARGAGTAGLPAPAKGGAEAGNAVEVPPAILATTFPSDEAMEKNWPVFRGWDCGHVPAGDWPEKWNGKTGEGILWHAPVPLPGQNSPIVWGDRVFLSGATDKKREVYCFHATTGSLLWHATVDAGSKAEVPDVLEETGYAASTMATDGARVYVIFAYGDVAAFDLNGKQVWVRHLEVPVDLPYGYATSLTVWGRGDKCTLIVKYDIGKEDEGKLDGKSALLGLDGATGQTVWETKRPVVASWSSPVVVKTPTGEQILTTATPWVMGYDADTGKELWRADLLGRDVAPTPVYADGILYVANDNGCMAAVKTDGQGNVTKTHVKWKIDEDIMLPDMVSPLLAENLIFYVRPDGTIYCYDPANGKEVWEQENRTMFSASPVEVGKRVVLIDSKGVWRWFEAGKAYKELGKNELGEEVAASPAFAGGRIFIRGKRNLYCIGKKP